MSDRSTMTTLKLRTDGKTDRLHKVLATSGLGSRRKLEERILQGEVLLNGTPAELGSLVKPGDRVEMDGKKLIIRAAPGRLGQVLMYNKPEGEITARVDPEGRPTVFERLPFLKGARWIAVGRLDFNTTGLLLFTTDGELANLLMHPSAELAREYVARAFVDDPDELPGIVERLRKPIELEDGLAQFDEVELIGASAHNALFKVSLREGRNREVRRMFSELGLEVGRLKRTRYGPVELAKTLLRGNYETMTPEQSTALAEAAGMETKGTQLIAELEAHMRRRERQAIEREKEKPTRRAGPLRGPQASVDAEEFSLGQGRPPDRDSPRGRRPRPEGRGPRRGAEQGARGPGGRTAGAPGQRERTPGAPGARPSRPGVKSGPGAARGDRQRPARGDSQPRERGPGRGDAQPRVPGQGRGRRQAEFKGPMDYANGLAAHDRPFSEEDDNRGNSIAAGETHLGNQHFQRAAADPWTPTWPPAEGQARPPDRSKSRGKPRPGRNKRPGAGGRTRNPQEAGTTENQTGTAKHLTGERSGGERPSGARSGGERASNGDRPARSRRRRGRPSGDRAPRPDNATATPGPSAEPRSAPAENSGSASNAEAAKKPPRRRTRKPKAPTDSGAE